MARIQVKRATSTTWATVNPILAAGEIGLESNTGRLKVGTGLANWSALPYQLHASDRGAANGVASLDSDGRVPFAQWGYSVIDGGTPATPTADTIDGGTP